MSELRFDDNGWLVTARLEPWPVAEAWSLLSPRPDCRLDEAALAHQARRFFDAELTVSTPKRYPGGATPTVDLAEVSIVARGAAPTSVSVVSLPVDRAPEVMTAARRAVARMGGAGFDVLLSRARRLWQVRTQPGGDERAPLLVAAVLASWLLAPILAPGGEGIFGVKGARERLAAAGW